MWILSKRVPIVQEYIDIIGIPQGVEIIAVATSIDRSRDNYPHMTGLREKAGLKHRFMTLIET